MIQNAVVAAGVAMLLLAGCARPVQFSGILTGGQEVPAVSTSGNGTVTAVVHPSTRAMTYEIKYAGLSGPPTAGHFHGPAAPGVNAGVVAPFSGTASPITGGATLTDAQLADVMAGRWYANLHTAANPNGEVRAQLLEGSLPQ